MQLNHRLWTRERIQRSLAEGRMHLHFMLSIYRIQLDGNRHFLHEHPHTATSWDDAEMLKFLSHPRVQTTVADHCQYGLTARAPDGNLAPTKEPARFASSSQHKTPSVSQM